MIIKNFKWFSCLLLGAVVIALIVGVLFGGLNLGIDFTGGSLITVNINEEYDSETVRQAALSVEGISGDVSVVKAGDNLTQAVIRIQNAGDEAANDQLAQAIAEEIKETYPGASYQGIDSVGGIASGDMISSATLSVVITCALMLIYIWIRFDLYSGIAAVAALLHDVIFMICIMCIFRVQVDSTFIAACLTIVGYSINDTVIVFDRIRDNMRELDPKKYTKADIVDRSIRETLGRTINTSLTTLIMIVSLYIFGVQSIKVFALPIIVGVAVGSYSSIFIASPIWMKLLEKYGKRLGTKKKVKAIR